MHIKIGSRKSKLALWQSRHVAELLQLDGHTTEIIELTSEGDEVLDKPLTSIGGKGVFTKALDHAILNGEIDIAVHSFKDIPTQLLGGLELGAILERENPADVIVCRKGLDFLNSTKGVVATSSNRRKSQWLHRYPKHEIVDIRGNVQTRIEKLKASDWDAAVFAAAGLIRLELEHEIGMTLDWMVHAPAQGAIAVVYASGKEYLRTSLQILHHKDTAICTLSEREFLNELNGGCAVPVGAKVYIIDNEIFFNGIVLNSNGTQKIEIALHRSLNNAEGIGIEAAKIALDRGAYKLISSAHNG
ncbi:MAG TPA: hydroxymethylbilane synthase [Flavobacteriales bacterium]|nr:hydroxymethylbilane synthase [Flavobacteriales bacterium]HIB76922.1 hydroxymethylbilane synthase [Flavobacteriales bacterium]HIN41936.1 hydroxymethylbilane synthase [Flavobacteriales bacterium]HIO59904.1 hydroxymethylbilane synthase [Flavobacteriales bacterium]